MNDKTWVPKGEIDKQRAKLEAPRKPKSERKNLGSSSEKSVLSAEDITRLKCLLNIDLRNVSFELSPRIDVSKYSSWFQSVVDEEDVHSCMARSLYFLACDIDLAYEQGICPDISKTPFVGSIYDAQDSMIILYNNRVEYLSGPMEEKYEADPMLINRIRSCFVSLIAMGFIGDVIDLINFGASMEVLALDVCGSPLIQDLYNVKRRPKAVGDLLKKLRILTLVYKYVSVGNEFAKEDVRIEFNKFYNVDPPAFSKLKSGLRVFELIPDGCKHKGSKGKRREKKGEVESPCEEDDYKPEYAKVEVDDFEAIDDSEAIDDTIDVDIRIIKESLGSLYPFLLIKFRMRELESRIDLERFVKKLAHMSLAFDWSNAYLNNSYLDRCRLIGP